MQLNEMIEVHDRLNPLLFDKEDKLYPRVKDKILDIVNYFLDYLEVKLSVVDIHLVGSNASFNYTVNSDLDIHVVANFDVLDIPAEYLQVLCNSKKASFNKAYDIKLRGIDVELYVEDVKANTMSNGIYSVYQDEWVKYPIPLRNIVQYDTEVEVNNWANQIRKAVMSSDVAEITDLVNRLYLMRKNSLSIDGEYGEGNQIFKAIRDAGLLNELKVALDDSISKTLSLESLSRWQLMDIEVQ